MIRPTSPSPVQHGCAPGSHNRSSFSRYTVRMAVVLAAFALALSQIASARAQETPPTTAPAPAASPLYAMAIDLSGSTVNCTDKECLSVSAARMNLDLLRPARVVLIPFYGDQADVLGPYNLGNPAEYAEAQERLKAMCGMRNPSFQTPLAKALDAATQMFTREGATAESRLLLFTDGEPTPGKPGGPGATEQYNHIFNDLVPVWRSHSWHIDTIGLNPPQCGSPTAFLDRLQQLSAQTGGSFHGATSANELGQMFLDAFTRVKGQSLQVLNPSGSTIPQNGYSRLFRLDPSVGELTVVVFKSSADTAVELFAPGGAVIKQDDPRVQLLSTGDPHYWLANIVAPASENLGGEWSLAVRGSGWFMASYLYSSDLGLALARPTGSDALTAGRLEGGERNVVAVQVLAKGQPTGGVHAQVSGRLTGAHMALSVDFTDDGKPTSCDDKANDGLYSACLPDNLPADTFQVSATAKVGDRTITMPAATVRSVLFPALEWLPVDRIVTTSGGWPQNVAIARVKSDDPSALQLSTLYVEWLGDVGGTQVLKHQDVSTATLQVNNGQVVVSYNAPDVATKQAVADYAQEKEDGSKETTHRHYVRITYGGTYEGSRFGPRTLIDAQPIESLTVEPAPFWYGPWRVVSAIWRQYWPLIVGGLSALLLLVLLIVGWRRARAFVRERMEDYAYPRGWVAWGRSRDALTRSANLEMSNEKVDRLSRLTRWSVLRGSVVDGELSGVDFRASNVDLDAPPQVRTGGRWVDLRPGVPLQANGLVLEYSSRKPANLVSAASLQQAQPTQPGQSPAPASNGNATGATASRPQPQPQYARPSAPVPSNGYGRPPVYPGPGRPAPSRPLAPAAPRPGAPRPTAAPAYGASRPGTPRPSAPRPTPAGPNRGPRR